MTTASELRQPADVVVVGGGSAGATLAARLSEDPNRHVLLLEAGQAFAPDGVPAALSNADNVAAEAFDWGYNARGGAYSPEIPVPRGRVLGGSSTVNAAVAIRARRSDIEAWRRHGVDGWSWDDVLATFKAIENTDVGDDAYHGRSGPLSIRQRTSRDLTPGLLGFIDAGIASCIKSTQIATSSLCSWRCRVSTMVRCNSPSECYPLPESRWTPLMARDRDGPAVAQEMLIYAMLDDRTVWTRSAAPT